MVLMQQVVPAVVTELRAHQLRAHLAEMTKGDEACISLVQR